VHLLYNLLCSKSTTNRINEAWSVQNLWVGGWNVFRNYLPAVLATAENISVRELNDQCLLTCLIYLPVLTAFSRWAISVGCLPPLILGKNLRKKCNRLYGLDAYLCLKVEGTFTVDVHAVPRAILSQHNAVRRNIPDHVALALERIKIRVQDAKQRAALRRHAPAPNLVWMSL